MRWGPHWTCSDDGKKLTARVTGPGVPLQRAIVTYWLVPASKGGQEDGVPILRRWFAKSMWGIRAGASVKKGDWLGFYVSGVGVVAAARVARDVTEFLALGDEPGGVSVDRSLWKVRLAERVWLSAPIELGPGLLRQMDIFNGKRSAENWGWLVHTKRRLSPSDFRLVTGLDLPV